MPEDLAPPNAVTPSSSRTVTRQEHLTWCKQRALEYVDAGDLQQAFASMLSDLGKHPETVRHSGRELRVMLYTGGHLRTPAQMRKFINDFN